MAWQFACISFRRWHSNDDSVYLCMPINASTDDGYYSLYSTLVHLHYWFVCMGDSSDDGRSLVDRNSHSLFSRLSSGEVLFSLSIDIDCQRVHVCVLLVYDTVAPYFLHLRSSKLDILSFLEMFYKTLRQLSQAINCVSATTVVEHKK